MEKGSRGIGIGHESEIEPSLAYGILMGRTWMQSVVKFHFSPVDSP